MRFDGSLKRNSWDWIVGLTIALGCFVIGWSGITSPASLGDEIYHYRFAKTAYVQQARPSVDPLYSQNQLVQVRFVTDPGWPIGLAALWSFAGSDSKLMAQLYQVLFYVMLILGVYFTANLLYGPVVALWASLLSASVPMLVSFSILFYTDMPATAVMIWSFYFSYKRKTIYAGILLAAAFMFKKVVLCFVPGVLLLVIIMGWARKKEIFAGLAFLILPLALVAYFENQWQNLNIPNMTPMSGNLQTRLATIYGGVLDENSGTWFGSRLVALWAGFFRSLITHEFSNSSVLNPIDYLKYFGFGLTVFGVLSLICIRLRKTDLYVIIPATSFVIGVIILKLLPDLRYLLPVVPFIVIFSARFFLRLDSQWARVVVVVLCFLQIGAVSYYVRGQRLISPAMKEALEYLKKETPKDSLVVYQELSVLEYAQRPMVWGLFKVRDLLWGTDKQSMDEIRRIDADYFMIKKSRVYDDRAYAHPHIGAYPLSFLERLNKWDFVVPQFDNQEVAILKIDHNRLLDTYRRLGH